MMLALAVGTTSVTLGFETLASATGKCDGLPPFPCFMFGIVGLLASEGDVRMLRAGGVQGASRIARHLWRMSWALWIATSSFFLGQAKVFPQAIRIPGLLALPVLIVLVTMLFWPWTIVRAPKLTDGAKPGAYRAGDLISATSFFPRLSRADVAEFLVSEALEPRFPRVAVRLLPV